MCGSGEFGWPDVVFQTHKQVYAILYALAVYMSFYDYYAVAYESNSKVSAMSLLSKEESHAAVERSAET